MGKGWIRNTVVGLAMSGVVLGAGAQAAGADTAPQLPTKQTYTDFTKIPQVYKQPDLTPIATMSDRMTAMVNKVRAQGRSCGSEGYFPPAPALVANRQLAKAAQGHSNWMAANNKMSHIGANGSEMDDRVEAAGYTGWTALAENVAYGQSSEQAVIDSWFSSPGHCKNFMKATYKDIGFGKATSANGTPYWTANLGRK
ncbi:MAG: CAP domain-containing protein [Actinomycetota bacterium]|nr:CAP domain-containing protein [Actinomycetota bacterium]